MSPWCLGLRFYPGILSSPLSSYLSTPVTLSSLFIRVYIPGAGAEGCIGTSFVGCIGAVFVGCVIVHVIIQSYGGIFTCWDIIFITSKLLSFRSVNRRSSSGFSLISIYFKVLNYRLWHGQRCEMFSCDSLSCTETK